MNSTRIFKYSNLTLRILHPRCYSLSSARKKCQYILNVNRRNPKSNFLSLDLKPVKYISNCCLMHTNDTDSSNGKNRDEEKMRRILEDQEFQNILKDFANDFGVDHESNEILDDIRKNLDESTDDDKLTADPRASNNASSVSKEFTPKFKEFSDLDSSVIHSYEENYEIFEENEPMYHIKHELKPRTQYNNLKRGITGVFDVEELFQVLRNESMLDITTITVPKEMHYADYLVLATAKSPRHSDAFAELLKKIYKQKKNKKDPFVKIEGEDSPEWKAIDMGNIVLHIFLEEARILYDIESLWLFDSKFDNGGNAQPDPVLDSMEEQMAFFNSLQKQSNPTETTKDVS